jgi:hypothetical protein
LVISGGCNLAINPRHDTDASTPAILNVTQPQQTLTRIRQADKNDPTRVEFQGISFTCPAQLASTIDIIKHEAMPLKAPNDKPDYVHSQYVSFLLNGQYADSHNNSDFSPEINIFPIEEYIQMFAVSESEQNIVKRNIAALQTYLGQLTMSLDGAISPVLWMDSNPRFHAHVNFIDFNGGRGIAYLTQFDSEPRIISNQGLTYVFQGITDDKKHFIWGVFPIRTTILPSEREVKEHDGYVLPAYFYDPKHQKQNQSAYQNYVSTIRTNLNALEGKQISPQLSEFHNLLSSIEIKTSN